MIDILATQSDKDFYYIYIESILRHSIQRQNSLLSQFECHETFAQGVIVNEKLCKNIALKVQATYILDIC